MGDRVHREADPEAVDPEDPEVRAAVDQAKPLMLLWSPMTMESMLGCCLERWMTGMKATPLKAGEWEIRLLLLPPLQPPQLCYAHRLL